MNKLNLLICLGALTACGGSSTETAQTSTTTGGEAQPAFQTATVEETEQAIANGALAVDANSDEHYNAHHIPGAIHARHDAVAPDALGDDRTRQLIFYCFNEQCMASHQAAEMAISQGYSNVFVMPAGIEGWMAAGKPTESSMPATE